MTAHDPVCDACGGGQFGGCPYCWVQPPEPVMTAIEAAAWRARHKPEMNQDDIELHREQDARRALDARRARAQLAERKTKK